MRVRGFSSTGSKDIVASWDSIGRNEVRSDATICPLSGVRPRQLYVARRGSNHIESKRSFRISRVL